MDLNANLCLTFHFPPCRPHQLDAKGSIAAIVMEAAPAAAEPLNPVTGLPFVAVEDRWVACDTCGKWRRVTDENADISGDKWYCHMNTWDPARANCEAEEENSEDDDVAQAALQQQNEAAAREAAQAAAQATKAPQQQTKRKKKKRGDDDDETDEEDASSDDDADYRVADDDYAETKATRSGRATRAPGNHDDSDGSGPKPAKRAPARVIPWTPDSDDALLSGVIKYGTGSWVKIMADPEFMYRLSAYKIPMLKNRWRKLSTTDFHALDPFIQLKVNQGLQKTGAQPQQQRQQPQQPDQSGALPVLGPNSSIVPPNTTPFTAYRPYPTHVFDLERKTVKAKDGQIVSAADAANQLSTPMDPSGQRKKRRGRRPKNANDDDDAEVDGYSDDSDAAEERAAAPEGANDNEFKDLDENLDNVAYMQYYDHRNHAIQLYDTYNLPLRDLKKQLVHQMQMKQQDALELIKQLIDAPDLHTRRATLAKALHAHINHFQTQQIVRQWQHAAKQMTTQFVHAQHEVKLKQDQQLRIAEQNARKEYLEKHGVPMPEDNEHGGFSGVNPKTGQAYQRGPYKKDGGKDAGAAMRLPTDRAPPPPGSTHGLQAFDKLPYYWRTKLHVAKVKGLPFPEVQGSTPAKALLQAQLDDVKAEWNTPAITNILMSMKVGEKALQTASTTRPPKASKGDHDGGGSAAASQAGDSEAAGSGKKAPAPARESSRKRRASAPAKRYAESDDDDEVMDTHMPEEDEEPEEDLDGIYIDKLYPLPNLRLKKVGPNLYNIHRYVQVETIYSDHEDQAAQPASGDNTAMTD